LATSFHPCAFQRVPLGDTLFMSILHGPKKTLTMNITTRIWLLHGSPNSIKSPKAEEQPGPAPKSAKKQNICGTKDRETSVYPHHDIICIECGRTRHVIENYSATHLYEDSADSRRSRRIDALPLHQHPDIPYIH
jgi:hypothetical protein